MHLLLPEEARTFNSFLAFYGIRQASSVKGWLWFVPTFAVRRAKLSPGGSTLAASLERVDPGLACLSGAGLAPHAR